MEVIQMETLGKIERKKISVNMNKKVLRMMDDLAKIFETTRTMTITALIGAGLNSYIKNIEKTWKKWKQDKDFADKKKKIDKKLKELIVFKKKWRIDKVPF